LLDGFQALLRNRAALFGEEFVASTINNYRHIGNNVLASPSVLILFPKPWSYNALFRKDEFQLTLAVLGQPACELVSQVTDVVLMEGRSMAGLRPLSSPSSQYSAAGPYLLSNRLPLQSTGNCLG
jgi:hypothetical protein